jgi:hypothetical protein
LGLRQRAILEESFRIEVVAADPKDRVPRMELPGIFLHVSSAIIAPA